jgi:hypothetical protein
VTNVARHGKHVAGRRKSAATDLRSRIVVVLVAVLGAALALAVAVISTQPAARPAAPPARGRAHASHKGLPARPDRNKRPAPTSVTKAARGSAVERPCTPKDLSVSTTTDRPRYTPSYRVTVVTKIVSSTACDLDLVPSGEYHCGESIVIDTWSSEQVFPAAGQSEECGALPGGPVEPGTADVETIVWNGRTVLGSGKIGQAPPGRYEAIGSWSWNSGHPRAPYQVAESASFEVLH